MYSDFSACYERDLRGRERDLRTGGDASFGALMRQFRAMRVDCALRRRAVERRLRAGGLCRRYAHTPQEARRLLRRHSNRSFGTEDTVIGDSYDTYCHSVKNTVNCKEKRSKARPTIMRSEPSGSTRRQMLVLKRPLSAVQPTIFGFDDKSNGTVDDSLLYDVDENWLPYTVIGDEYTVQRELSFVDTVADQSTEPIDKSDGNQRNATVTVDDRISVPDIQFSTKSPNKYRTTNGGHRRANSAPTVVHRRRGRRLSPSAQRRQWFPVCTVPVPFSFMERKETKARYSQAFLRAMLDDKRAKEAAEEMEFSRRFVANPVPPSTYQPDGGVSVEKSKSTRSTSLRAQSIAKRRAASSVRRFRPVPVPASTFQTPRAVWRPVDAAERRRRAAAMLRSASEPRGLKTHSKQWRTVVNARHGVRCLPSGGRPKRRRAASAPDFRRLHSRLAGLRPTCRLPLTVTEPFNFSSNVPSHFCWNWSRGNALKLSRLRRFDCDASSVKFNKMPKT